MNTSPRLVIAAFLALCAGSAVAAGPVEGQDYQRVDPAVPTSDASKVVVTQFFSYQCPHCYKFEKSYAAWAAGLPADVKKERAAVAIGHASWTVAARSYYALAALKATPRIDEAFFGAIHRERKPLADETAVADWVAGQGVDRAKFQGAYRSFSVQLQTKRADDLSRAVRLPSVPAILVDGKYLIPVSDDGDFRDQLAIANALVERARGEKGAVRSSP